MLAIDHNIRVKASDVFRNNFAGKINRQATEAALGTWTSALTSAYEATQHIVRIPVRNSALREERKAHRHSDRVSLIAYYNQYRNRQRDVCKGLTALVSYAIIPSRCDKDAMLPPPVASYEACEKVTLRICSVSLARYRTNDSQGTNSVPFHPV